MRVFFLLLLTSCWISPLHAQDSLAIHYANQINVKAFKKHVKTLASPKMEGRNTGEPGQKRAAIYIYQKFKEMGVLSPNKSSDSLDYFQPFKLEAPKSAKSTITINSQDYYNMKDFLYQGAPEGEIDSIPIVFVGWGLDSITPKESTKDKAILFLSDNLRAGTFRVSHLHKQAGAKVFLHANGKMPQQYARLINWEKRILARKRYRLPQSISSSSRQDSIENPKLHKFKNDVSRNMSFAISPEIFQHIMGTPIRKVRDDIKQNPHAYKKYTPQTKYIKLKVKKQKYEANSENVLAFIPGKDKKEECIVISAHYDHIGKRKNKIFYGANDNASGTAALIELAKVFQNAYKAGHGPKRGILFIAFSAEEKGLLGSNYYVNQPSIPINQTIVNLNIDMIGRKDNYHEDSDYIYLLGTNHLSPDLRILSDSINQIYTKLVLDYKYDHEDNFLYKASDQASFVAKGIPAIFYFNGLHEDYHQSTDTPEKIDYKAALRTSQLIFHTAWELANKDKSPKKGD